MKYIFIAGAPGSKWSSVAKNIYYSPSINRSDSNEARLYLHKSEGTMHVGAYFDPGMEFNLPESMSTLTKIKAEEIFDSAFNNSTGVKIIKSHIFSYYENIEYLRELWPECPLVLVYRSSDSCLGWWVRSGHFDITYPNYKPYYKDLKTMADIIDRQNEGILYAWKTKLGVEPINNLELSRLLNIDPPPNDCFQEYKSKDIKVKVIKQRFRN